MPRLLTLARALLTLAVLLPALFLALGLIALTNPGQARSLWADFRDRMRQV